MPNHQEKHVSLGNDNHEQTKQACPILLTNIMDKIKNVSDYSFEPSILELEIHNIIGQTMKHQIILLK